MLDSIRHAAGQATGKPLVTRSEMARQLLVAVLEDDAASHGACHSPDDEKVIVFRRRGRAP